MRTKHDPLVKAKITNALVYIEQNPDAKVIAVAKEFKVNRGVLRSRLNGHLPPGQENSRNTKLMAQEEKALYRYIDRLNTINLYVQKEFIIEAANIILRDKASKTSTPQMVRIYWINRFLLRYSYNLIKQKVLDQNRQVAKDLEVIWIWFKKLLIIILAEGILTNDIYNIDEIGFRIKVSKD